MQQKEKDEALEALVQNAHERVVSSTVREAKLAAFRELTHLVAMRSPEKIREMEVAKGLV